MLDNSRLKFMSSHTFEKSHQTLKFQKRSFEIVCTPKVRGTVKKEKVVPAMENMMRKLGLNKKDVEVRCKCSGQKLTIYFIPRQSDYLTCSQLLCTFINGAPCNIKIDSATLTKFNQSFFVGDFDKMVDRQFNVIPTACSACVSGEEADNEQSDEESSANDDVEDIVITVDDTAI